MKQGIIFDLDGTLWNSTDTVVPAWNHALCKHRQKSITTEDMQSYMGKTIDEIAKIMFPNLPAADGMDIIHDCCAEEQKYVAKYGGVLYPGVEQTLATLAQKYLLFVVSNCETGYIEAFFTYHKLDRYFVDTECSGRTGMKKGDNIRAIIERNHLDKATYIGDTQGDLDAADYAGIPFIFAKYGFGDINRDVTSIDEFSELIEVVGI